MTVFIWTKRIGLLTSEKDPGMLSHYAKEYEKIRDQWKYKPVHIDSVPYIAHFGTRYYPERMRNVI